MNELDAVFLAPNPIRLHGQLPHHLPRRSPIGLAAFIATARDPWLRTGGEHFARLAPRFWTKIFAVAFAMGWCPAS